MRSISPLPVFFFFFLRLNTVKWNTDTNSNLQLEEVGKSAAGQFFHILGVSIKIPVIFSEERGVLMEVYIRQPAVC